MTTPKAGRGGIRSLRAEREAAGLSRQALATRADCSIAAVAVFEHGYEPERSDVLPRLWAVLDALDNDDGPVAGNRAEVHNGARDGAHVQPT